MLTYGSCCSGIEAASVAWEPLGFRPLWFSEIDKAACRVLRHHWPHIVNYGDMRRLIDLIDLDIIEAPDVLVGGTPCFPAGTFVTTPTGLKPIEDIRPGDLVLTHKGRYQRVLRIGSKDADTVVLKGQGHPGLVTTREHPFLVRQKMGRTTRIGGKAVRETWITDPSWERAEDIVGKHWSSIAAFPETTIPEIESSGNEVHPGPITEDLMWLAGAYLGDGWPRIDRRRSCVIYGVNGAKAEKVVDHASKAGLHATPMQVKTGVKVQISNSALARWLNEHFGSGSRTKRLPGWIWGAPAAMRQAFLDGYTATDGTPIKGGTRWASTSWELVVGLRMLLNSLGRPATAHRLAPRKGPCVIQGREVNETPYWTVASTFSNRSSFEADGLRFGLVRSIKPGARTTVFNLEVEHDNSYCADGFVVHNCQDFSIAGARAGLDGDRGQLTLIFIEIANAIDRARARDGKPRVIIVWENVPGVLNHKANPFGNVLAAFVGEDVALEPPGKRWTNAGAVYGPQRAAAWRVLDAQYFGLAQRRRRVFVVSSAREGFDPAELLFEFYGLRRDLAPSRAPGEAVAGTLDARSSAGGFPGTDGATAGRVQPWLEPSSVAHISDPDVLELLGGLSGPARDGDRGPGAVRMSDVRGRTEPLAFGGNNTGGSIDVATAQNAHGGPAGRLDFESETFVVQPALSVALRGREGGATAELGEEVAHALRATQGGGSDPYVLAPVHAFDARQADVIQYGNLAGPLDTDRGSIGVLTPIEPTIAFTAKDFGGDADKGDQDPVLVANMAVRRLMPIEGERLQGFPDNHTAVPDERGKIQADGPRYKQIGNSKAVPVVRWIGKRILWALNDLPEINELLW